MNESTVYEGGCLCGAVRYRATGNPLGACHCHCEMCRKWSGALFGSGVGFPADAVSFTQEEPALYRSSEQVSRGFCSRCGSSVSFHWLDIGSIWLLIGTLDRPEMVTPEFHMFAEEQVPGVRLADGLPRHARFPPKRKGG